MNSSKSWNETKIKMIDIHYKPNEDNLKKPDYKNRWHYTSDRITNNPYTVNITSDLVSKVELEEIELTLNKKSDGSEFLNLDWNFKNKFEAKLSMNWWVNYQYQTEFNPEHAHTGITSFVIWMKIPTHYKDQHNLDFHSNAASDFQFTYSNILGGTVEYPIFMSPEMEGTIMVFPSTLHHQVYPFFNTDEPRISIAGNLLWSVVEL